MNDKMGKEKSLAASEAGKVEAMPRVEKLALELLENRKRAVAIDMEDFVSVPGYGKERVLRDQESARKKLEGLKTAGELNDRKFARLLEGLLIDQIELSNWFGESAYTIAPAEYDDLFHGVDLAVGIKDGGATKHIAFGIDATSSAIDISKKLRRAKRDIKNGRLTAMEYFHSDEYDPNFYGTMRNIPYVVIGVGGKTINELAELWMSAYGLARIRSFETNASLTEEARENLKRRARESRERLVGHRVQTLLLEEIQLQLETFKNFAAQEGQKQIAERLSATLDSVSLVLRAKPAVSAEDEVKNIGDPIYAALKDTIKIFDSL